MAFVYFLRSGDRDAFKIGKTAVKAFDRTKAIGPGNPDHLSVFKTIEMPVGDHTKCELFLHGTLASRRILESVGKEWFRLTVAEAEAAIESARQYLATDLPRQKEADRLAKADSDSVILQPSDDELKMYQRILDLTEQECLIGVELERLKNDLKLRIGTSAGLAGIATWKTRHKMAFHLPSFRKDHAELVEQYKRPCQDRPFNWQ